METVSPVKWWRKNHQIPHPKNLTRSFGVLFVGISDVFTPPRMLTLKHTSRHCQGSTTMQRCGWLWPHGGPGNTTIMDLLQNWKPNFTSSGVQVCFWQGPGWDIPYCWHPWHMAPPLRVPWRCEAVTLIKEGLMDQENTSCSFMFHLFPSVDIAHL